LKAITVGDGALFY